MIKEWNKIKKQIFILNYKKNKLLKKLKKLNQIIDRS